MQRSLVAEQCYLQQIYNTLMKHHYPLPTSNFNEQYNERKVTRPKDNDHSQHINRSSIV